MKTINGKYSVNIDGNITDYNSNDNVKIYMNLDLKSKSVKNNKAIISVDIYFQHNTINVPINSSSQSGYVKLNNVKTNFNWNPSNYGSSYIPKGTLVKIYSADLEVSYGNNPSDLTFDVEWNANLNPQGAFPCVKGNGSMQISKITNNHYKYNNLWKSVFTWIKILGKWKRAIVWKKVNGIWKKGR